MLLLIAIGYVLAIVLGLAVFAFAYSNHTDTVAYVGVLCAVAVTVGSFAPGLLHNTIVACVLSAVSMLVCAARSGERISFGSIPLRLLGGIGAVWSVVLVLASAA